VIPVGHRALVARERDDGRYDLHYAHWGAHEWRLLADLGEGASAGVDPVPIATGRSFGEIVREHVDFQQFEALYRVSRAGVAAAFFVCWFGFPVAGEDRPRSGALIEIDAADPDGDGALVRGWVAGTKGALGALVEADLLGPAEARTRLVERVSDWTGGERAAVFGPGVSAPDGSSDDETGGEAA